MTISSASSSSSATSRLRASDDEEDTPEYPLVPKISKAPPSSKKSSVRSTRSILSSFDLIENTKITSVMTDRFLKYLYQSRNVKKLSYFSFLSNNTIPRTLEVTELNSLKELLRRMFIVLAVGQTEGCL